MKRGTAAREQIRRKPRLGGIGPRTWPDDPAPAIVKRLIDAGWTRRQAEAERRSIDEEPPEDWEGQL